jgi:prepilin-type N-terminal cleavage/methylation domain-containing protein
MKHFRHTPAFTMLELVFVIAVIGIISALALPRFDRDNLQEAADQLASHIRYTQHLAMQDDKFDSNETGWFNRRWTLRVQQNVVFGGVPNNDVWTYTVFSDLPNFAGHNPDLNGMALNPLNPEQFLSGGYDNTLDVIDPRAMRELQLGTKYGIQDIDFGGGCRSTTMYLHFDYLGRPMNSFPNNNQPYQLNPGGFPRLITQVCTIQLCTVADCTAANVDEQITIAVEPETGYTHIL